MTGNLRAARGTTAGGLPRFTLGNLATLCSSSLSCYTSPDLARCLTVSNSCYCHEFSIILLGCSLWIPAIPSKAEYDVFPLQTSCGHCNWPVDGMKPVCDGESELAIARAEPESRVSSKARAICSIRPPIAMPYLLQSQWPESKPDESQVEVRKLIGRYAADAFPGSRDRMTLMPSPVLVPVRR